MITRNSQRFKANVIKSKNIIIKNYRNVPAVYRCEFRNQDSNQDFQLTLAQNEGHEVSMYCLTDEDASLASQGRHEAYSQNRNFIEYFSSIPEASGKPFSVTVQSLPAVECRIYHPVNRVSSDMLVLVRTFINGNYVQLYGGLYSECEINSYETIKDNYNSYSEYIRFFFPRELVKNQPLTQITVDLIPFSDLSGGVYELNQDYVPDNISFIMDFKVKLSATKEFDSSGIFGLRIKTDTTVKEFEDYYKYVYHDTRYSKEDTYRCSVRIYDDPQLPNSDHVVYEIDDQSDWIQNSSPDDPLIDVFLPFNQFVSGRTFQNWELVDTDEKAERTFELNWDEVPESLLGIALVQYQCTNEEGETQDLTFYSNYFPISRDDLKYVIDRPATASLWSEFGSDYKKYRKDYMININLTSEVRLPEKETLIVHNPVQMVYKPLFFKTSSVDSISLIKGITQRVGINLQDFQTKVSAFKIRIGNQTFLETERTDLYVIFKINASVCDTTQTVFHVLDQDSEYISSGTLKFTN